MIVLGFLAYTQNREAVRLRRQAEEAQHARDRSVAILAVTEAVNSSLALEEVLAIALKHAGRAINAPAGALFLLRTESKELTRERSYGLSVRARAATRHIEEEPVRTALALHEPVVAALEEDAAPGLEHGGHPSNVLVVPIRRGHKVMATMELYLHNSPLIGDDLMALLKALAAQTATAIRHAQMFSAQEETSLTDELTHLHNRRYLARRFLQEKKRAERYGDPVAVLMIDIDHFKQINDTRGHLAGDTVLAKLGGILLSTIRQTDVCARYGGEEFAAILHKTSGQGATILADRLRAKVAATEFPHGIRVTVSVGVAASDDPTKLGRLIESADKALYAAKEGGRNRVEVMQELLSEVAEPVS